MQCAGKKTPKKLNTFIDLKKYYDTTMIKAVRARAPAMVTAEDPWFVKERMANGTRWPDQIES